MASRAPPRAAPPELDPQDRLPDGPAYLRIGAEGDTSYKGVSPFKLKRALDGAFGQLMTAKTLVSGQVLIQCSSRPQALRALTIQSFLGLRCTVTPADRLNSTDGRCYAPTLKDVSEEELLYELAPQGVIRVTRLKSKGASPNPLLEVTFRGLSCPSALYAGYEVIPVERWLRTPMVCRRCGRYGHTTARCKRRDVCCGRCSDGGHTFEECQAQEPSASSTTPSHHKSLRLTSRQSQRALTGHRPRTRRWCQTLPPQHANTSVRTTCPAWNRFRDAAKPYRANPRDSATAQPSLSLAPSQSLNSRPMPSSSAQTHRRSHRTLLTPQPRPSPQLRLPSPSSRPPPSHSSPTHRTSLSSKMRQVRHRTLRSGTRSPQRHPRTRAPATPRSHSRLSPTSRPSLTLIAASPQTRAPGAPRLPVRGHPLPTVLSIPRQQPLSQPAHPPVSPGPPREPSHTVKQQQ